MKAAIGKKEKRQRQILLTITGLIVFYSAYAFGLQPLLSNRSRLGKRVAAERARLLRAQKDIAVLPLTRREWAVLDEQVSEATNRYVLRPVLGSFPAQRDIYRLAQRTTFEISAIRELGKLPTPRGAITNAPSHFLRYTLDVAGNGSFADVIDLLALLESENPYMGVVELSVREEAQSPERHRVTLRLEWPVANDQPPPVVKGGAKKKKPHPKKE